MSEVEKKSWLSGPELVNVSELASLTQNGAGTQGDSTTGSQTGS